MPDILVTDLQKLDMPIGLPPYVEVRVYQAQDQHVHAVVWDQINKIDIDCFGLSMLDFVGAVRDAANQLEEVRKVARKKRRLN